MLKNLNLDKLGMSASFICAVHCAIAPLVLPVMALWGLGFIWGEAVEIGMLIFALAIGVFALTRSYRNVHQKVYPFYFLVGGIALILLSHTSLPHELEPIVLPVGALMIVYAHWVNYRLTKECMVCAPEHPNEVDDNSTDSTGSVKNSPLQNNLSVSKSTLLIKNEESL